MVRQTPRYTRVTHPITESRTIKITNFNENQILKLSILSYFRNFFRFKNKIMVVSPCQNGGVNFGNLGGRFPEVARNGDPPAWGLLF